MVSFAAIVLGPSIPYPNKNGDCCMTSSKDSCEVDYLVVYLVTLPPYLQCTVDSMHFTPHLHFTSGPSCSNGG